jgi:hypothetical protein
MLKELNCSKNLTRGFFYGNYFESVHL